MIVLDSYFIEVCLKIGVVFGVYWLVNKVVLPFVNNEKWHDRIKFYMPVFRNLLFLALSIEVIIYLGHLALYLTMGLVTGLVIVFWSYLKEFCLGIIFKLQRGNIAGQRIKVKEYAGKIIGLNNTKLEIESEKGEIVQIPYSHIVGDVEVKPSSAKYLIACVLSYTVKESLYAGHEQVVLNLVARLPYVVDSVKPKLEIVKQDASNVECKLVVYTNDERFIPIIKARILKSQNQLQ